MQSKLVNLRRRQLGSKDHALAPVEVQIALFLLRPALGLRGLPE